MTDNKRKANVFHGESGRFLYSGTLIDSDIAFELSQGNAVELYDDKNAPIVNYNGKGYKTDSDGFASLYDVKKQAVYPYAFEKCPLCGGNLRAGQFKNAFEEAWRKVTCNKCDFVFVEIFSFLRSESLDGIPLDKSGKPISERS